MLLRDAAEASDELDGLLHDAFASAITSGDLEAARSIANTLFASELDDDEWFKAFVRATTMPMIEYDPHLAVGDGAVGPATAGLRTRLRHGHSKKYGAVAARFVVFLA